MLTMHLNQYIIPTEEQAWQAMREANQRVKSSKSWVIFCRDWRSHAGCPLWFDSKQDLVEYLDRFPFLWRSPYVEEEELIERANLVRQLLHEWKKRYIDPTTIGPIINELSRTLYRESGKKEITSYETDEPSDAKQELKIEWMGPVQLLLTDDFSSGLQSEFLELSTEGADEEPIVPPEKIDEFLDYLSDWGALYVGGHQADWPPGSLR